ncbi:MAG: PAS domain S-box protein [Myxococcota bacterium]
MASLKDLERSLELTTGPVLAVGRDGTIRLANRRLEELFGYSAGDLVGRSVDDLVPEDVREYHPELREAFFLVPHERSMGMGRDLFAIKRDGTLLPVEVGLTPFETDDDFLVIVSVLDITERRSQQDKIRLAMDAASSAMVMVDDSGVIALVNREACRSFGYEMDALVGKSVNLLVPAEFQRRHGVYMTSFMRDSGDRTMAPGRSVMARRIDGSEFPVEITLSRINAHDGSFVMSTIIDITSRRAAEAESARVNADLKRLNDDLASFAYSASHDLKAPLSTIAGLLEYIRSDLAGGDVGEATTNVERCRKLALQLGQRVEDALSVSRNDQTESLVQAVEFRNICETSKDSISALIEEMNVKVTLDAAEDPANFQSDRTRISQIIENLMTNSVRYANRDRAESWVRVVVSFEAESAHLVVEDNGLGFPSGTHHEVFKMFKRFHPDVSGGSGLGLALVKKSVDRLGGTITFESSPDGTRFDVVLPNLGLMHDE